MPAPPDKQPPIAAAMIWVHRLTSISLEMVLPAVLGRWLDGKWNTGPWLLATGAALGFTIAIYHLVRIGQKPHNDV